MPKKIIAIIGVSAALGILFDYFFYNKMPPGLSFPLYILLILACLFALGKNFKERPSNDALWLILPLLFFSVMVSVRASYFLSFLNIVMSGFILLMVARTVFKDKIKSFFIRDYFKIFVLPFLFIPAFLRTISQLIELRGALKEHQTLRQIIRGVLLALPALLVFTVLFSSADLVFQKYISGLIKIDQETIARAFLIICAAFVFIGAFGYIFQKREENISNDRPESKASLGVIETSVLLGLINILFFIFIAIQFTYFFGGESNIKNLGFTYSEYARKGFFELIVVAIISFLIVWAAEKDAVKKGEEHALPFKIFGALLIIQVLFIIVSAFKRLWLYEEAYGFTAARLYGHTFVIWLSAAFLLLFYKIFAAQKENSFAFNIFISVILFLAALNILNPDAFIARQNLDRFDRTGLLDIWYLRQLSDDALPETIKIINLDPLKTKSPESFDQLKKSYARDIYWEANSRLKQIDQWQKINLSGWQAEKILQSKIKEFEQFKDYKSPNDEGPLDYLKLNSYKPDPNL